MRQYRRIGRVPLIVVVVDDSRLMCDEICRIAAIDVLIRGTVAVWICDECSCRCVIELAVIVATVPVVDGIVPVVAGIESIVPVVVGIDSSRDK